MSRGCMEDFHTWSAEGVKMSQFFLSRSKSFQITSSSSEEVSLVLPEDECLRLKHCKLEVAEDHQTRGGELTWRGRDIAGESKRPHQPCASEATAPDPSVSPRQPSKTEDLGLRGARTATAPPRGYKGANVETTGQAPPQGGA